MSKEVMLGYKDKMIETLTRLMRVQSEKGEACEGMPFGPGPAKALEVFLAEARALGFRTGSSAGYAGWAEMGPEDAPLVGAVCHLDVVPAAGWPEAYEPKVADGRIIGRGSVDDKGPATAVLYAMKSLLDEGRKLPCRLRLIVGLDEESGSACMAHYREHEDIPLGCFTADADFPVIQGEKGHWCFDLLWEKELDTAGDWILYEADNGTRGNVIPGEAVLKYKRADGSFTEEETIGRMGHASMPELAKNAIQYALADAYKKRPEDEFLHSFMHILGTGYDGAGLGIKGGDASGDLTLNVGIFKYKDGRASLRIDIRYPVTWDIADLRRHAASALKDSGFRLANETNSPPLYRSADDPLVRLLMEAYREVSGRDEQPICIGGGTYARSLPNTLAFGPLFPEEENLCHQKGEYITVDTLLTAAGIYRASLIKLAEHFGRA